VLILHLLLHLCEAHVAHPLRGFVGQIVVGAGLDQAVLVHPHLRSQQGLLEILLLDHIVGFVVHEVAQIGVVLQFVHLLFVLVVGGEFGCIHGIGVNWSFY